MGDAVGLGDLGHIMRYSTDGDVEDFTLCGGSWEARASCMGRSDTPFLVFAALGAGLQCNDRVAVKEECVSPCGFMCALQQILAQLLTLKPAFDPKTETAPSGRTSQLCVEDSYAT